MERNNKLPEKWYIIGCNELAEYLKTVDNNPYNLDGCYNSAYHISNDEYRYWINFTDIPRNNSTTIFKIN